MADTHILDEFGFGLTAGQRLQRMRGISPSNGEYFREPAAIERENPAEPGMGFSLRDWNDAVLDNVTRDMLARLKSSGGMRA